MVHALLVTIKLRDAAAVQPFLAAFKPLLDHSNLREPQTLTYELHTAEDDESTVLVLERYVEKSDLERHMESDPFKTFLGWVGEHSADAAEESAKLVASVAMQHFHDKATVPAFAAIAAAAGGEKITAESDRRGGNGVLVFCGARPGKSPLYEEHAKEIGALIAAAKRPLVYGGGSVGVMGAVANAVQAVEGGKVIGVIPRALAPREVSGKEIGSDVRYCDSMGDRKTIMFRESEFVISLPGGIGTLDELLEVFTLYQLNCYRPAVGLLDTNGFYQPFLALLRHLVAEGFLEEQFLDKFVVAPTPAELWEKLMNFERPPATAASLVWPKM